MRKLFLPLVALVVLCACGEEGRLDINQPTLPDVNNPTPVAGPISEAEAAQISSDFAHIMVNAGTFGPQALRFALDSTEKTKEIRGETGTLTMTWERGVEDDTLTRIRKYRFDDYTGDGKPRGRNLFPKRALSHITGEVIYQWVLTRPDQEPAQIKRTVKGTITATVTFNGQAQEVNITFDEEFHNDPVTKCNTLKGSTKFKKGMGERHRKGETRVCPDAPVRNG